MYTAMVNNTTCTSIGISMARAIYQYFVPLHGDKYLQGHHVTNSDIVDGELCGTTGQHKHGNFLGKACKIGRAFGPLSEPAGHNYQGYQQGYNIISRQQVSGTLR
jgi:hypothetical protein